MMLDNQSRKLVSRKILSAGEVARRVGPPPRKSKVIMCHGAFDIVHPGHIRHLLYAKSKADILVASITGDGQITKSANRPFVPEELRAINLAALEVVDYVIVDSNPTPLETLKLVQPDYYAKGYDYAGGKNPKTQAEIEVLASYGGEILYTPGDVVYSSSHLIENAPPDISVEKLLIVMEAEGINFRSLHKALDKLASLHVHVVGDTIVDSLTQCSQIGGMIKTPTISVRYEQRLDFVGGAGIVAKHMRAAGAKVCFSTILGEDELADFVLADLDMAGVETHAVRDSTRPTTNKNAIVVGGYRLLKIDTLDNLSISDNVLNQLIGKLDRPTDIVAFCDFRHGIFNRNTIPFFVGKIPRDSLRVADSQVASRWGNILEFQDFDLITPNEREARFALGDQDSVVRPLATNLFEQARCRTLILKMGDRGTITYRNQSEPGLRQIIALDSFAKNVVDPVGAGDALLAYASLALRATGNDVVATILGSIAAGIECAFDGNVPVTIEAMHERVTELDKLAQFSMEQKPG